MEQYGCFCLIESEVAIEQLLKYGIILRSVGASRTRQLIAENSQQCYTNGGDICNFAPLLLLWQQQINPTSIAVSPYHFVANYKYTDFNKDNMTTFINNNEITLVVNTIRQQLG